MPDPIHPIAPRPAPILACELQPAPPRDLLSAHLEEMRAFNADEKRIKLGRGRRCAFHLVVKIMDDGEALITNKLTGTTAREHDAAARAALLEELRAGLLYYAFTVRAALQLDALEEGAAER